MFAFAMAENSTAQGTGPGYCSEACSSRTRSCPGSEASGATTTTACTRSSGCAQAGKEACLPPQAQVCGQASDDNNGSSCSPGQLPGRNAV